MPHFTRPQRPHLLTFTLALFASAPLLVTQVAFGASGTKPIVIANSGASDPSARQIVRAVADESLKTISTKDGALNDEAMGGSIVERLEEPGPIVLPSKILVESAPGSEQRSPAANPEKATEKIPEAAPKKTSEKPPEAAKDDSVPAEKSLSWLQNGNKRYVKKSLRADGKARTDRERLAKTQRPHAIVLSCSDSHAPPETVFDQSLGEIYVVRTAGESLDSAVIASLEHAVESLGPRLLVVMGHTGCSAISAAVQAYEHVSTASPSLDLMIADIQPRLPARGPAGASSKDLEIESSANAQGVAADLLKRSPLIKTRVDKGELILKPALYYNDSGVVKFY